MKRLNKENINTPDLSWDIFEKRWKKQLQYIDFRRYKLLAKDFKNGKYLDLGVFNSPLPTELKRRHPDAEVWGIDHAERVINHLKANFPEINYIVGDVMNLPFGDGYFDYVVAGELIEHLESPEDFIKEAIRVLKPGGVFALSTPIEEGIAQKSISNEHLWSFNEKDIRDLLDKYGEVKVETFEDKICSPVKVFMIYLEKSLKQEKKSKVWSLFLGRYMPLHKGHIELIRTALREDKNACVALRDTVLTEKNPFTIKERVKMFEKEFEEEIKEGRLVIVTVPDITEVCYGRGVGWRVRQIHLHKEIENISATKIRRVMKEEIQEKLKKLK